MKIYLYLKNCIFTKNYTSRFFLILRGKLRGRKLEKLTKTANYAQNRYFFKKFRFRELAKFSVNYGNFFNKILYHIIEVKKGLKQANINLSFEQYKFNREHLNVPYDLNFTIVFHEIAKN